MIANLMLSAAIALAFLSPMTGSFLKCWADRARTGKSVSDGRSFCDNCGKTLAAQDLIPVLSWVMAGGKSRCCRQTISPTLLIAEVAALAMALSALLVLPRALWLPAMLLAWGLQALALLTGVEKRTAVILAVATAAGALALPLLSSATPVSAAPALVGGILGFMVWLVSLAIARPFADAALVLPLSGALLGPHLILPAIALGAMIAWLHGRLRKTETRFPTTSLAVGLATATWTLWIGLSL